MTDGLDGPEGPEGPEGLKKAPRVVMMNQR